MRNLHIKRREKEELKEELIIVRVTLKEAVGWEVADRIGGLQQDEHLLIPFCKVLLSAIFQAEKKNHVDTPSFSHHWPWLTPCGELSQKKGGKQPIIVKTFTWAHKPESKLAFVCPH